MTEIEKKLNIAQIRDGEGVEVNITPKRGEEEAIEVVSSQEIVLDSDGEADLVETSIIS